MPIADLPPDETERLAALYERQLLDTPPEERFDRITRLAKQSLAVDVAYVAFIDGERQWFKSICGFDAESVPRQASMCSHTILTVDGILCPDTLEEPRFVDNPNVVGPPHIRFYLGYPLRSPDGYAIGTFCAMGTMPREITESIESNFRDLGAWAQNELSLIDVTNLQSALRQVNVKLEQRSRFIRNVLGQFLTDQVAEQLLEHPEGLKLGGENREVSVLMSDLRGFTPLSERSTPEQVVDILNRYLAHMTPVIERYGGTIDEFIGDAILVVFGAPLVMEQHAHQAVACALDMQLAMETFNAENLQRGFAPLEMGIAVNTGAVVVGNIGSPTRMKYGVVGSAVNMTARIQSFTLGKQVLISERTLDELGEQARVDGHLRVKVKGVEDPVCIYDIGGLQHGDINLELPRPSHLQKLSR